MEKYWIGDLCYVIKDWVDFCNKTFDNNTIIEGDITLSNGTKISYRGTSYGDGEYQDQYGNSYSVDSGLIGVIKVSDIDREDHSMECGHIFEFESLPRAEYNNGVISFGKVSIDTDPSYDEDEY